MMSSLGVEAFADDVAFAFVGGGGAAGGAPVWGSLAEGVGAA